MASEIAERPDFRGELRNLINCHSMENGSNTPAFILAEYLVDCLNALDKAITSRAKWCTTDKLTAEDVKEANNG